MSVTDATMISKKQWFLIGVTTGVVVSLIVTPLVDYCHQWPHSEDDTNWYSLIANSDFNPVVRLNGNKTQSHIHQKHINQKVFRPKYYSQELEIKDNLLICVYLSSDALNVSYLLNQTIDQTLDKVMLFYDKSSLPSVHRSIAALNTESIEVPFVRSIPKYLNLLKYLFDSNIVQNFNFIFIISDKTFINQNILRQFLNNLSVSQHIFASSQTSYLHRTKDFNDFVGLDPNPNHILDSGTILSTSLLLKCNLDHNCLNRFRNNYPNKEVNKFETYYLNQISDQNSNQTVFDIDKVVNSLTIFPVTNANTYKRLNLILCQKLIDDSIKRLKELEDQIITSNDNESVLEWPLGVEPSMKATNRFEVIRWSYFNESHVFMPNDFDVILPVTDIETTELSRIKSECIEWLQSQYKDLISEEKTLRIINLYKKFDASRGLEYILDIRSEAFPDIKRLQVMKPFNKVELVPGVPYVTENVRIV